MGTVSLIVCGLLKASDAGATLLSMNGQKVLDIHTDPDPGAAETPEQTSDKPKRYGYKYTTLRGYFLQDDPQTKAQTFDFMKTNFGREPAQQGPGHDPMATLRKPRHFPQPRCETKKT